MKTIRPRTWAGFKKAINDVRKEYGTHKLPLEDGRVFESSNQILFRGQPNAKWELETTLERATSKKINVLQYMLKATLGANEIESFTGSRWSTKRYPDLEKEINERQDSFRVHLPCYDYLVYLRHHGYPSPLLDWTESPYIAAFFAYAASDKKNKAAVYCYIEKTHGVKGGTGGAPMISVKGPYVSTHKRHFAQKAQYTIATQWDYKEEQHYFCNHETVFQRENPRQDVLIKIELPTNIRTEVLKELNDYNINYFTLFQSEDALIKAMAMKSFDHNEV